jgi:hypothetical protein
VNTLNKKITARFFAAPEGRGTLIARWSALMQDMERRRALTVVHHTLYAILLGHDWRTGFVAPKDPARSVYAVQHRTTASVYAVEAISCDLARLAAEPTLVYFTPGEPVVHPWGVVCLPVRHESPNPFYGLLSSEVSSLISAVLPCSATHWPTDAYLPPAAYRKEEIA